MKMKYWMIAVLLTYSWGLQANSQTPSPKAAKTTAELVNDIRDTEAGTAKARSAIRTAVERRDVDVLIAGLSGSNYDIRSESLEALKIFPKIQERTALLEILRDDQIWTPIRGDEQGTIQTLFMRDLAAIFSTFDISVAPENFFVPSARKKIADDLAAKKVVP